MAHDFLGTFNQAQFQRFASFALGQVILFDLRIKHLEAEMDRIGTVTFRYDRGGIPQALTADPETSYMAKLLAAYEVMGGNAFIDLRTRGRTDPVFLLRTNETVSPHTMSNGEPIPGKGLVDGPSAELVRTAREYLEETLAYRYNRLERKIRRALDYRDQLELEVQALQTAQSGLVERAQEEALDGVTLNDLLGEAEELVPKSLKAIFSDVQALLNDKNYRPITPDTDEFGIKVHAPYSSYDVPVTGGDPNTTVRRSGATVPQRQQGTIVKPGQGT